MRAANRATRITQTAVIVALLFAIGVFAALGVVVWRVNDNMNLVEAAVTPHAREIVNATVDMMHDLGGSFHNMHDISGYTNDLVRSTAGSTGAVAQTVNNSAVISQKLAEFMQHPTLSISLGGNGNGR